MQSINWERLAALLFCILGGGALLFFVGRFLLLCLLPFLAGALLAALARIPARRLARGRPRRLRGLTLLFFLLLLLLSVTLLGLGTSRLVAEAGHLLEELEAADPSTPWASLFGGTGADRRPLSALATQLLTTALEGLASLLPTLLSHLAVTLPSALLFLLLTLVSGFYFCLERQPLTAHLPLTLQTRLSTWRTHLFGVSLRYLRAYLLLFGVTAGEMLLGFLLLRVRYAVLLSLLVAAVDLLPVLGVGSILLPWSLLAFLRGSLPLGFGLLALYLLSVLVRQLIEPRILGGSLGLHPLLTLFAGYAGYRLFGVPGLLLGPPVALLCKTLSLQLRTSPKEREGKSGFF